jgi:hypothetical protein
MTEHEASRTLVKSPPELWAELSDQESLAGHLAEPFGEIRITRLEPETAVAWEGERASGTVRIEPSGWGTRVTLTAQAVRAGAPTPAATTERPAPDPLPPAAARPEAPRRGLRALLRGWRGSKPGPAPATDRVEASDRAQTRAPAAVSTPAPAAPAQPAPAAPPPAPAPEPAPAEHPALDPDAVLVAVLDRLGAAHKRPFSRS